MGEVGDPFLLQSFLEELGLPHLYPILKERHTVQSLCLLSSDRTVLLSHLRVLGVDQLSQRQKLVNGLSRLTRTLLTKISRPVSGPNAPEIPRLMSAKLREMGAYRGAIGLFIQADGTLHHVNEGPCRDVFGSWNLSPVAGYCKIDGPIVAEIVRLSPLVGRPIYLPRCDEDPLVAAPHQAFTRNHVDVDEGKLADFRDALGANVVLLTTAVVRNTPSDACVGLIPAYDRWAGVFAALRPFEAIAPLSPSHSSLTP